MILSINPETEYINRACDPRRTAVEKWLETIYGKPINNAAGWVTPPQSPKDSQQQQQQPLHPERIQDVLIDPSTMDSISEDAVSTASYPSGSLNLSHRP